MSFADKVIIITGASSGIGAAAAVSFAKEGARVSLIARNEAKLNEVVKLCEQHGKKPLTIIADVAKDEEARTIVKRTVDHFGQLDVLVNNAGIARNVSVADENLMKYFDQVMNTNLRSVVLLTNQAAPHLVKTKGNVINISSVVALTVPGKNYVSYAVSKAGLDHFTRCTALELAPYGVRVNGINPGPVKTDIATNAGAPNPELVWEAFKASTALKRIGDSEEIADLILFLASDKAKSITGSSCLSDNGSLLK